jgi:hypothetical protein
MLEGMNRRSFLELGAAAGAVVLAPRLLEAQAAAVPARAAQARRCREYPSQGHKLYDNVYLLQGQGGNMALQTGPEGSVLIDSSFAPAVPRILDAIAAAGKDIPSAAF